MIQDILGQPQEGVIGGQRDLMTIINGVNANRAPADRADVGLGFTSPEQGRDYDAAIVSQVETVNADTASKTLKQAIPWGVLVALVVVYYFIARNA